MPQYRSDRSPYQRAPGSCHITCCDGALAIVGELDVAEVSRLDALTDELVEQPLVALTVDVGRLSFVDAAGMRAVWRLWARLDQRGVVLDMAGRSRPLERVAELCGQPLPWARASTN